MISCVTTENELVQLAGSVKIDPSSKNTKNFVKDTFDYNLHGNSIRYIKSADVISFSNINGVYLVDTIWGLEFEEIVFEDRDLNKFSDVVYKGHENIEVEYLYCYEPNSKVFKKIVDHELYGYPQLLYADSNIYFTYTPDGCSWYNWESHLFTLKNYRIEYLNKIYYDGCTEGAEEIDGVSFNLYKWNGRNFKLILQDTSELYVNTSQWTPEKGIKDYWIDYQRK